MKLRVGSLCTGYGGLEMGLTQAGVEVDLAWLAESDPTLDPLHPADVPNLGDLTLIDWTGVERVDLVTAGFPCQPFSAAGAQLAEADPRYLWPQVARCLEALRPRAVLLENVRNLPSMRTGEVWANILDDLGRLGYAVRWLTLGACAVGAAHHRHRVFALGVQRGHETDEVTRLDVQQCGAKNLLPTMTACDGDGRGTGDAGYWDRRERTGRTNGFPLDATVALLPTPRASVDSVGGPGQRGSSGDLAMPSAVQPEHWGRFADAVARHEAAHGPAPAPTEPNRNGAPRLRAEFAEWLMCIPAGHVTGRLDRRAALKAMGNGVCPPQVAAAWRLLTASIDTSLGQPVASRGMTTTNDEIRDLQDRDAQARGRVIAAGFNVSARLDTRDVDDALMSEIVEAAMMELAKVWREQAAWWLASGKRGAKGTAAELTQAAGRLAGFAVGLRARPVEMPLPDSEIPGMLSASDLNGGSSGNTQVEPLPDTAFADAVARELSGLEAERTQHLDPVTAYLTGAADTYEPTPEAPPVSDVQQMIDNPFTSPAAPGANRAPVSPLPYHVLPVLAGQLEPRTRLSHSYVETFESCSLKAMLQRASRHNLIGPQRPSWSLIGGRAFHSAVEQVERDAAAFPGRVPVSSRGIAGQAAPSLPGADLSTVVEVDGIWQDCLLGAIREVADPLAGTAYADQGTWHASNSGKEGYDWWRVEGALMLHRYLEFHDAAFRAAHTVLRLQPLNSIAPEPVIEQEFVTSIAADAGSGTSALTTRGFIDIVWLVPQPTPTLIVADWKTGSRRPTSTFQLGEYAHALTTLLPAGLADVPVVGSYWLARKGEYTPQVHLLSRHGADELTYRYRQVALGASLGIATPNVTDLCVACSVRDYCPAQASR